MSAPDIHSMQYALRLAARGLGRTWPNPAVGAIIVKDGMIAGCGTTGRGGRPHAETIALEEAGERARGATMYVTLEPCAHQGQTPPCTEAIIKSGISQVVAACTDPNSQVSGKGFAELRAAGIEVTEKFLEEEAQALNEGFFSVIKRGRPFVALKLATSLDGKMATADGESKWITSEQSRSRGQLLRAQYDAILTGIGTVLADDPALTCRLPGREADSPQRVVMDGRMRTPYNARVLPAWIFTYKASVEDNAAEEAMLKKSHSSIYTVEKKNGHLSIEAVLKQLAEKGITRLLVETGGTLATAFLKAQLVDRIYWFRGPLMIGENGLNAVRANNLPLAELPRYTLRTMEQWGDDILEIYEGGAL